MAQKLDFQIPFNDLTQYVPVNLRNSVVTGLLDNLFNRFMTRDESVPLFGFVGADPASGDDRSPRIPQPTSERDINAITPVLSFMVGTERVSFTVQDLVAKAKRVGIESSSQNWLYSQGNNFAPPIDFDRFSNFFNYFWIANAVQSTPPMGWNPEKLPEYYVIERPADTDLQKLSCRTSSTVGEIFVLNGAGFVNQDFSVSFLTPTQFAVQPNAAIDGPLGVWQVSDDPLDYDGSVGPSLFDVPTDTLTFDLPALPLASGTTVPTTPRETAIFRFVAKDPSNTFSPVRLVEFRITREATFDGSGNHDGYASYQAGDALVIQTTFLSQLWSVSFTGPAGPRPQLGGVRAYNQFQTIGGVQVKLGDRVLVQGPPAAAGIYVVSSGDWSRASDFSPSTWAAGAEVFVNEGTHANTLWRSVAGAFDTWSWVFAGNQRVVNDWQEGNFWVKSDELDSAAIDRSLVVQATRPIIQFSNEVQLNSRVEAGKPVDWRITGVKNFIQQKSEFNQVPLFDLFRYDGTHAQQVSSIFYFVEDATQPLDVALQRRVKRANNDSLDFVFNHGCVDTDGRLLFYMLGSELKTVWHPGYKEATVTAVVPVLQLIEPSGSRVFLGTGTGTIDNLAGGVAPAQTLSVIFTSPSTFTVSASLAGSLGEGTVGTLFTSSVASFTVTGGAIAFLAGDEFIISLVLPGSIGSITTSDTTQQQIWSIVAQSATTFEVAGSKLVNIPSPQNTATVGVPYDNGEIAFTITGSFTAGDTFIVAVGALERPRYVVRGDDGRLTDRFGGEAADLDDEGAYQVSRTFINNPYNDIRGEITEGVSYSHFRNIQANQIDGAPFDTAFGGQIKLWSEQHSLLASLLMQRDLTPISMIDLAKRLYEAGLNAIRELFIVETIQYYSTTEVAAVTSAAVTPTERERVGRMLDRFIELRLQDAHVRSVLADTTAGVPGFPATLPQLGISPLVFPYYAFDRVLGRDVFVHHDGHSSLPFVDTQDFRQEILGNYVDRLVLRSDGTSTPAIGSTSNTPPTSPYKGLLWLLPSGEMRVFDVDFDTTSTPPITAAGQRWFQRGANVLAESDGTTWIPQPDPLVAWKTVDLAETLNELIFQTEVRLHDRINPNQRKFDFTAIESNPFFQQQLQRELFTFAAREGIDPLATNYSAQDPFTWNYRDAALGTFAPVSTPAVPARWYNALIAHHQTVPGVIPAERPDLEPWKLLGFSSSVTWWASLTPLQQATFRTGVTEADLGTFINGGNVRLVAATNVPSLSGLQVIDGVQTVAGDTVLLTAQTSAINNGVWVVSMGGWSRALTPLSNRFFSVLEGDTRVATKWAVTSAGLIGIDPVVVVQAREWSDILWSYVQAQRPALRLSVNVFNDELLPPYVRFYLRAPTLSDPLGLPNPVAPYALTNTLPTGISQPFVFGEGSPVEEVWERSVEFGYAQAKALFRFDPIAFLGFTWGFNWVEVDDILYDGMDISMPGHKRFRLHGESTTLSTGNLNVTTVVGAVDTVYTLTYDAYDDNRRQNFSIRNAAGTILGFAVEGVTSSVSLSDGATLSGVRAIIEDNGVPFKIGDTFVLSISAGGVITTAFVPTTFHRILGFGQIFTNSLREVSIDTQSSYAISAYREWDVNMGYRAGGLVATDDLLVYTETDTLSEASYDLIFKKNDGAADLWIQALRVVLVQRGTTAIAPPERTGPAERGTPTILPGNAAEDWVFRIEGYNPNYLELAYYDVAAVDGGVEFPASPASGDVFFRHDLGVAYSWSGSEWVQTTADLQTFNALNQEATPLFWYQSLQQLGIENTRLPLTIVGLQNVVNFLFGYAQLSTENGWIFESSTQTRVDQSNGRHRNWQLEIEVLIDRVFRGLNIGQGHIVNPFIDQIQVRQDTGLLAPFSEAPLFDIFSHAAAFDVVGSKIKTTELIVQRGNETSTIRSEVPIFSMHALIDDFEHLFIFRNFIAESDGSGVLYDPFSGGRNVTYKFNGRRQNTGTMRPELGGHYLVGNEVRRNLQASTDSLANAYDPDYAFENTLQSKHALALLGFSRKDYFSDLDITDKSQFNFWRGLIQAKGTTLSFDAYLNNDRFEDAKIDEYWAYKVAEYGDARQRAFPELRLRVSDSFQQFTLLQFDAPDTVSVDGEAPGQLVNFAQISRFDEQRWFSIDDLDQDTYFKAEAIGSFSKTYAAVDSLGDPVVFPLVETLPFIADALVITGPATKLNGTTLLITAPGSVVVTGYGAATPRYNPVKLLNYAEQQLVEEIPLWHPIIGQHTPTALESINVISTINPARYNYSPLAVNNNSFDPLRPWTDKEVGRVWFDTRRLEYVPYHDVTIFPNRSERLSRWGSVADFASIDVYEWVKSSVPPSEYNQRARIDAGNADLDPSVKASGEVALEETYSRDRVWRIRPVAWSFSPVATDIDWGDRPPMKYGANISDNDGLNLSGTIISLESGTFSDKGIVAGDSFGTWQHGLDPKPLAEGVINDAFRLNLQGTPLAANADLPVTLTAISYPDTRFYGPLFVSFDSQTAVPITDADGNIIDWDLQHTLRVSNDIGSSEELLAYTVRVGSVTLPPLVPTTSYIGATIAVTNGATFQYIFPLSGLRVDVVYTGATGTIFAHEIALAIAESLDAQFSIRDATTVTWITPPPDSGYYSNDPIDPAFVDSGGIGWRVWEVPTQAQLDADGRQPVSSWRPYAGDIVEFSPTFDQLQEAVAYQEAPLTLNNGTVVERYAPTWTDWQVLRDVRRSSIATVTSNITFQAADFGITRFDLLRTAVYVNGIAQVRATYSSDGPTLTIDNVRAGSKADVVVFRYEPTAEELAFDPDVTEDFSFQRQFKRDTEYASVQERNSDGNITTQAFYFWVRNKTTVASGKKLSVQAIQQQLRAGPPNFLTFQHILPPETTPVALPWRYDAITLSGLSYVVTREDSFKLRFTRNFTLRDDPNDLDLKNTHVEWSLMRPSQKTKIPQQLWTKLVDSAAELDSAGNAVPSLRRVLYDERRNDTTRFGFGPEQTLAPSWLLRTSLSSIVVNTKQLIDTPEGTVPHFIEFIDAQLNLSDIAVVTDPAIATQVKALKSQLVEQRFFSTPELVRQTMAQIWAQATVAQINEMFFAALEDVLASNFELTDIFKTSRLSMFSVQERRQQAVVTSYE